MQPENEISWFQDQLDVINSPGSDRIIVEAGPGTGKTAVACARVAHLLGEEDFNPSSILMISFTRTAVAEMKNRIAVWVGSGLASSINIATLDQTAFSFGIGSGQEFDKLMGSFEDNIESALNQLREKNEILIQYLSGIKHVVLDEAQDITGIRCSFISLIIDNLPSDTGITVFADRVQSIYGFTNDLDFDSHDNKTFIKTFDFKKCGFRAITLSKIHRTDNKELLSLFIDTRKLATETNGDPSCPRQIIKEIQKRGPSKGDDIKEISLNDGDLVLFRKRASALMAAQFCPGLFRLRLPGYPSAVFPWIGYIFHSWTKRIITREEFNGNWNNVPTILRGNFNHITAWDLLCHFAINNRGLLDVNKLRTIIARPRLPVELCYPDYGMSGPVFSTIHASKGRESDRVYLMLPKSSDFSSGNDKFRIDHDEEARVYYVGATRVRKEFFHGTASTMFGAGRLDPTGKRVAEILSLEKKPKFQFGLSGDIDEKAVISIESALCPSEEEAHKINDNLIRIWNEAVAKNLPPDVKGELKKIFINGVEDYKYRFIIGKKIIAWSGNGLSDDLWTAAKRLAQKADSGKMRPPDEIPYLRMIGLRTCAIPHNPAVESDLHAPYSTSGFFLAPMIVGFPSLFFRFQKKRRRY